MKKLLALLLCMVMVVAVFAGCNNNAGTNATNGADATNGAVSDTLPDDITITIGIPESALVEDYDTNAYTLWLEEQTGYDIEFVKFLPSAADYKAKLSTALVNGDELPDILVGFQLNRSYYQDLGEDGYIIDMKPFFEDKEGKAKVWWDRVNALDETTKENVLANLYSDDGESIWSFPVIEHSDFDVMDHQMVINQEWLKTLNLEMPTDLESLYEVLKAFKTKDPNGNGKADEIPLLGSVDGLYGDPVAWILNMFTYVNYERNWSVDEEGQLYTYFTSDEYREALIFIRKLVDEGLFDQTSWGLSNDTQKSLMAPLDGTATIGIAGMHSGASWPVNTNLIYQYVPMEYWGYATITPNRLEWWTFITEDCEYPEAAWNLMMLAASEEGGYWSRYGEKGVDWDWAPEGSKSFLDRDARIEVFVPDATGNGVSNWTINYWGILTDSENEVTAVTDNATEWNKYRFNMMKTQYENYYEAAARKPENTVGVLRFTEEESEEIAAAKTNVSNVVTTARSSFCTGKSSNGKYTNPSDDKQWEQYKQEILDQGYEQWRDMAQVVYDDMYGKNAE